MEVLPTVTCNSIEVSLHNPWGGILGRLLQLARDRQERNIVLRKEVEAIWILELTQGALGKPDCPRSMGPINPPPPPRLSWASIYPWIIRPPNPPPSNELGWHAMRGPSQCRQTPGSNKARRTNDHVMSMYKLPRRHPPWWRVSDRVPLWCT